MASTNPARGMRDFLPADIRKRNYVISIIKEVYESYGFEPLETPAVENLETLMGKYGEEGNQLVFKILKRGEKLSESVGSGHLADLALRYDLTVPLARVVANNKNQLPKFFKRYQIQPVWRADRPAKGRFREFYQCDVDAIGSSSVVVEAELIVAVAKIFEALGIINFEVKLNHRRLLTALLKVADVPEDKHADVLIGLDKLDKVKAETIARELMDKGVGQQALKILNFGQSLRDKADQIWTDSMKVEGEVYRAPSQINLMMRHELLDYLGGNLGGIEALEELERIVMLVSSESIRGYVMITPLLARGLSYYTGAIMEIKSPLLGGSLGGGGRYDGLIGMFGKEQIPACGFSLGLERILVVMEERGMFPPEIAESTPADVMVTIWNEETAGESLKLASELRPQGIRVTVYPEPDKLGKQIKYADSIKVPFVCVLGESEIAEKKVTLKDMKTGEQVTVSPSDINQILIHKQ